MQSEMDSLRRRITELELRNAEPIKQIMEENNRHDARLTLVKIGSFDHNTFWQTFSRFSHVICSYFGYVYKIWHQIECRLLYCIKFYIISVSIPFGKHSANIQPFRSCESVKVQLGLKFGNYFGIRTFRSCESVKFQLGLKFDKKLKQIDRLILSFVK